jgi:hypothetical protein
VERATRAAIAVGLVVLAAWSAWARYRFLASSPYPMGVDGYFYPIQLRSLLEDGTLLYPSSPLAFYLMAPLAWLTDPITGAKLGAAIGGALIAFPAYGVGIQLGGNRAAGVAAAVIATTSAGSWYLSVEFVKNGWGLTMALGALWLALRAIERPTLRRIAFALAGVVAAALTHKMAVAIVVVIAGAAIAGELLDRRGAARRAALRVVLRVVLAAIPFALVAAVLWPERFVAGRDLGALGELFSSTPHWLAPALSLDGGRFVLPMGYEALAGGVAALLAVGILVLPATRHRPAWWKPVERTRARRYAAIAAIALALFLALPWIDVGDPQGLGFRLRIAAFVPLALVAAIFVGQGAAIAGADLGLGRSSADAGATDHRSGRSGAAVAGHRWAGAAVVAAIAIGFAVARPSARPEGVVRVHPAMVAATQALAGAVPRGDTVVISERHILFMAAYYARTPIKLRPERIPPERRWRLMPLAFIGKRTDSLYRLLMSARATPGVDAPLGLHPRDPNGLVLVPEATWAWIVERLPPKPRRYYGEWHTI